MMEPDPLALTGPIPCDGCLFVERCREMYLACQAFAQFANGVPERTWSRTYREPSAEIYARLLG